MIWKKLQAFSNLGTSYSEEVELETPALLENKMNFIYSPMHTV